jgi:hypothetical protein
VLKSQFSLYVMNGGNKQGIDIKFYFKAGLSATENLYWCKRLTGSGCEPIKPFIGGILNFETEGTC